VPDEFRYNSYVCADDRGRQVAPGYTFFSNMIVCMHLWCSQSRAVCQHFKILIPTQIIVPVNKVHCAKHQILCTRYQCSPGYGTQHSKRACTMWCHGKKILTACNEIMKNYRSTMSIVILITFTSWKSTKRNAAPSAARNTTTEESTPV
jgi:hypothetical protein